MAFGNKILKYKDDILKDLANVVAIDSVSADGCEKPQKALEYMLNRGKEMGLVTKMLTTLQVTLNTAAVQSYVVFLPTLMLYLQVRAGVYLHLHLQEKTEEFTAEELLMTKARL